MATTAMPAATLPESAFLLALGTPALRTVPPQTGSQAQRAIEEWERNLCENKAVAILEQMQAGRPALIKKDGADMLIAIVLDRPLAEAKALVEAPDAFIQVPPEATATELPTENRHRCYLTHVIGVTCQHEVLMVGLYTLDPA